MEVIKITPPFMMGLETNYTSFDHNRFRNLLMNRLSRLLSGIRYCTTNGWIKNREQSRTIRCFHVRHLKHYKAERRIVACSTAMASFNSRICRIHGGTLNFSGVREKRVKCKTNSHD